MIGTRIGSLKGLDVREVLRKMDIYDTYADNCIYKWQDELWFRERLIGKVNSNGSVYDFRENEFKRLLVPEKPKAKSMETEKPKPQVKMASSVKSEFTAPVDLDVDKILKESRKLKVSDLIGEFNYELS